MKRTLLFFTLVIFLDASAWSQDSSYMHDNYGMKINIPSKVYQSEEIRFFSKESLEVDLLKDTNIRLLVLYCRANGVSESGILNVRMRGFNNSTKAVFYIEIAPAKMADSTVMYFVNKYFDNYVWKRDKKARSHRICIDLFYDVEHEELSYEFFYFVKDYKYLITEGMVSTQSAFIQR